MNKRFAAPAILLAALIGFGSGLSREEATVSASSPEAANGLDLTAVGELFKNSANLEAFERALNDPDVGVNNLDLDGDGRVDFIRVVEETGQGVHLIVLQVPLAENEFQDVATIEVESAGGDRVDMQVHGNDLLYGPDYYVTVSDRHIRRWPIFALMYRPVYRPYRSAFHFGYYPNWWRPRILLAAPAYRARTGGIAVRNAFVIGNHPRVMVADRIHYIPRMSPRIQRRMPGRRPERGSAPSGREANPSDKTRHERGRETPHHDGPRTQSDRRR
jgi:hypothetical protein